MLARALPSAAVSGRSAFPSFPRGAGFPGAWMFAVQGFEVRTSTQCHRRWETFFHSKPIEQYCVRISKMVYILCTVGVGPDPGAGAPFLEVH